MFYKKEKKRTHHTKGQLQMGLVIGIILMITFYYIRPRTAPIVSEDFDTKAILPDSVVYKPKAPPPPSSQVTHDHH